METQIVTPKTEIPKPSVAPAVMGILFNGEFIPGFQLHCEFYTQLPEAMKKHAYGRTVIKQIQNMPVETNEWMNIYGGKSKVVMISYPDGHSEILPVNTLITARTVKEGIPCGYCLVDEKGKYGFMPVYADTQYTAYIKEGPRPGEEVRMFVNYKPCKETFKWTGLGDSMEISELNVI